MSEAESPPSNPAKGRLVLWLATLGVPLLLLLAWWPGGKGHARPALPNPNGFDYFVKAGGVLAGVWTNLSHQTLTASELRAFLSANQASLDLVREGLRHRSHTHMDYDATYIERIMTNQTVFRQCVRLLIGEGWLAELEGRPGTALDSYLDGMRLGQECSRGGIIIERLVGVASEQRALAALRSLIPKLESSVARRALQSLQQLDASQESSSVNLEAESEWIRRAAPLRERLMAMVNSEARQSIREARDSVIKGVNELQASRRRAIVEAAARLFEMEKGRRPTGYTDLVPAYLKAVPLDPTTGKEITHPF